MPYVHADAPSVALASAAVAVGAVTPAALPGANLHLRRTIAVTNNGDQIIYVGPSGVTTATGTPIAPGGFRSFDVGMYVTLYAIAASGTQDVRTLEQS